ncbi:MAG TPA: molybdate ABC transporter substrate-binding protein [Candidatus Acidoferrales bacterium]|nr:molybdate ABC transporter substrate-binding protein [Candidatus Acidoferrales bacterium]
MNGIRPRSPLTILLTLVALLRAWPSQAARPANATPLTVFAAASLSEAFGEIGHRFEAAHPGLVVRFDFEGSQQLAAQLEHGAAADVFASADERWMADVRQHGLVEGDAQPFARNRLVLIVPATNPGRIRALPDLARPGIKLVVGADAVPVGRYTRQVLARFDSLAGYGPLYRPRVLRNVVSEEENVKAVVGKVQLGEADAGFVYRSDVSAAVVRYVRVVELPDSAQVLASYPIAALARAPQPGLAREFVAYVVGPEGRAALSRHGFLPPGGATP